MTQVLAAITEKCAFIVADRRLTHGSGRQSGKVLNEDECKLVNLSHINVIGYTGLAKLNNIPTNEWIAITLAKADCIHAGHAVRELSFHAVGALPPLSKKLRRQAFLMCGWRPFGSNPIIVRPHITVASNFHDDEMTPTAEARKTFRENTRTLRDGEAAAVFAIGEPFQSKRERNLLRSIRRATCRENGNAAVLRLLAEEIFHTSLRAPTVGDQIQACCIPIANAFSMFSKGISRMSGIRARDDRSTCSYFDHKFNENKLFFPTFVSNGQAFTDIEYTRSKYNSDTSISFRVLYVSKNKEGGMMIGLSQIDK